MDDIRKGILKKRTDIISNVRESFAIEKGVSRKGKSGYVKVPVTITRGGKTFTTTKWKKLADDVPPEEKRAYHSDTKELHDKLVVGEMYDTTEGRLEYLGRRKYDGKLSFAMPDGSHRGFTRLGIAAITEDDDGVSSLDTKVDDAKSGLLEKLAESRKKKREELIPNHNKRIRMMLDTKDFSASMEAVGISNITDEELASVKKELDAAIKKEVDSSQICVRRRMRGTIGIMKDERFKTQFETGTSSGMLSQSARISCEMEYFGYEYGYKMDNKVRPVYGYLDGIGDQGAIGMYGDVKFVMKDHIRSRTTVTFCDTLNLSGSYTAASEVGEATSDSMYYPDAARAIVSVIEAKKGAEKSYTKRLMYDSTLSMIVKRSYIDYVEVQYHGGLSLKDVKEVHIPSDEWVDLKYEAADDRKLIEDKCKKFGIEIVLI